MKPYYEHNGIVIYLGDCREILPTLEPVDLILTDPPYGIGEAAGKNKSRSNAAVAKDYGDEAWDNSPPEDWVFGLIRHKSRHQIIFGGNYFTLPPSSCWLVWDKDNTGDFADCELAWTNLLKAVRMFKWRWNGMLQENMDRKETRFHPTQKPLSVMAWAISQAPECASLGDPYMGSGTSLVAAKARGMKAWGIEQSERYAEIAAKRLSQEVLEFRT